MKKHGFTSKVHTKKLRIEHVFADYKAQAELFVRNRRHRSSHHEDRTGQYRL